ncbi:L-lysine exporter family protein LysE/ArgO [Pseudooceanicola nitratireducens]|jgi:L-lysine exporter family protein LysE/ArgO|uniref:L-lysine exporter family protein LysE/ArgO n=2 Tax=Pseudooceanicola nitratireducens TaxID=517719 RepID=A0A1I1NQ75_9RHOB|nr:L-lysine exporter family protein LysE/ArgO [Pseudooceanicola nitratireducens]SFC96913.1 L-lysine exporter family protein LysE/ArgO [Pseudooceanicola nitratireducens]|eukprot:g15821.t1
MMTSDAASAFLAAYGLGLSLIVAIGAQNAFVLRQGLRREHVLPVVLTCAISDAVLIAAGVAGFAGISSGVPWLVPAMRYGGALFLFVYGGLALRNAWRGGQALTRAEGPTPGLGRTITICLLLTWGNPHVYLDTVGLMGAISSGYHSKLAFALGGALASASFFTALGFGARFLAPVFARPTAWRWLDAVIGVVMWSIALSLL